MREPLNESTNAGGAHFEDCTLHTTAVGIHVLPKGPDSALRLAGVTTASVAHEVLGALSKSLASPWHSLSTSSISWILRRRQPGGKPGRIGEMRVGR
jgi:hypothetical protein